MPKLSNGNISLMIPITQILDTGNVRLTYNNEKIVELANSILINGLINPITVKKIEKTDDNGNDLYELTCGHRRLRAYQYLVSQGQAFTSIPAVVKNGSTIRLQLIENIQRENLSIEETEKAIQSMLDDGMTQSEIAQQLSKSLSWVHDTLKGTEVRNIVEANGIDTSGISSKALSQVASIPAEKQPQIVKQIKKAGGTVKEATKALNNYKKENNLISNNSKSEKMIVKIETVIETINDYRKRFYNDDHKDVLVDKICNDLISLFEAYQRK